MLGRERHHAGVSRLGKATMGERSNRVHRPIAERPRSVIGVLMAVLLSVSGCAESTNLSSHSASSTPTSTAAGAQGRNGTTGLQVRQSVAVGYTNSCALRPSGEVDCWGGNSDGSLGIGASTGPETCTDQEGDSGGCTATPVPVHSIRNAIAISAGFAQVCASSRTWTDYMLG